MLYHCGCQMHCQADYVLVLLMSMTLLEFAQCATYIQKRFCNITVVLVVV